jgi:molecular chaperone GrpE (heat shock protein)
MPLNDQINPQISPASSPEIPVQEKETEETFAVPILPEFMTEEPAAEELPFIPSLPEEPAELPLSAAEPAEQPETPADVTEEAAAEAVPVFQEEEPAAPEPCAPVPAAGIPQEQLATLVERFAEISAANAAQTAEELSGIRSKMAEMDARVSSLRRLADMHQDIEKKLNDEINEYKDNFYRRIVNPILVEFFEIQEDMHADALSADESAAALLNGHVDAITRTLRHYGVTVETVSVGDLYDPRIHKPVRAIPTDDAALDKKIAKTRQTLVHFIDGKIVERAQVQVYQYTPAAENAAPAAENAAE